MAALTLETHDREKPILLVAGEKNPLAIFLVGHYSEDFTIAYITNSNKQIEQSTGIYRIRYDSSEHLKNLEEKIEYAIVFLEEGNKKYVGQIFEKLGRDRTRTIVVVDLNSALDFADEIRTYKKASNFYFVFSGDTYSEQMDFNPQSPTVKFIEDAIRDKKIVLTGHDLNPIFPIYLPDTLLGINQILFTKSSKNKSYFLFYNHPQTYISAIHVVQRVMPELEVEYEDKKTKQDSERTREELEKEISETLDVNPSYLDRYFEGFEKSIQHFLDRGPIKKDRPKIIEGPAKIIHKQKPKIKHTSFSIFWALFIFLFLNFVFAAASIFFLKNAIASFRKDDYQTMKQDIKVSKAMFDLSSPVLSLFVKGSTLVGFSGIERNYNLFSDGLTLLNVASSDFDGIEKLRTGMNSQDLSGKIADALYLYFSASELHEQTKNDALNTVLTPDLSKVLAVSQVAYQVLGYDREKTYLLLFQNDAELRPTGGFIGSVGELHIREGKVTRLTLQDVYEYDGKLKVHVEPYYIVRRYLQPNLYLRDSNFDLSFQDSAARAALLYSLEGGAKVDGVIAVNFEAIRRIIGDIGPLKLSSYNQTLTADNAFDFLEKTIDNNFFPGSTQKRDVIQALFDQIMVKLSSRNSLIKVARLLPKLAIEKQILFAFSEKSVQSVFSSLNTGGEYNDQRSEQSSIDDFLGVSEANIGVNKANINISRSLMYIADISGPKVFSKALYSISNSGKDEYKVFLRFVTPLGSRLSTVRIDGQKKALAQAVTDFSVYEKKNFSVPLGLEVNQDVEADHQVFGFVTTVPGYTKQTVEVDYDNGARKTDDSNLSYSLVLIKQPGTKTFPLTLNIDYGNGYTPHEVSDAQLLNGEVSIKRDVDQDKEFNLNFLKR